MDISAELGAALVSVLVIVMCLFLLVLQRGSLSERQQTGVWVVFTILFFSICNLFLHGSQTGALSHDRQFDVLSHDREGVAIGRPTAK
jgi:hypothetical protein